MNLQQISSPDELTRAALLEMIATNPLLGYIDLYRITGNADYLRKASKASGGKYRSVNDNFPDNKVNPEWAQPALTIIGDKVEVDQAHERRGGDIPSQRAKDLRKTAREIARFFAKELAEGDGSGSNLAGFRSITPASQKIWANTSSTGLNLAPGNTDTKKTAQAEFIEKVLELTAMVEGGPQVLLVPQVLAGRITSVAKDFVEYAKNDFGKMLPFINGIPILPAGYGPGQTPILDSASQGSIAGGSYSIFAIRFGEGTDVTYATSVGLTVKDLGLVGVHYTHNIELDVAAALENDRAIAELRGIKL